MNTELLRYKRAQALRWIGSELARSTSSTRLDVALDELVRNYTSMVGGSLYGWIAPPKIAKGILLDHIPFWPQTDNYRDPHRTCFSSTNAMQVKHHAPNKISGDNEFVERVFSYGDTTIPSVQAQAIESYGLKPFYSQTADFADIDRELERGNPVGVGILHRGPRSAPRGGHWFLIVGRTADKLAYICLDPYGSIGNGYTGPVKEGHHVEYSVAMLKDRWTVEGLNTGHIMYIEPAND